MQIGRAALVLACLVAVACTSTSGSSGDAATDSADVRDVVDANGAAPELQLPPMRGDEEVHLSRMHPAIERWSLRLPGARPAIWTDGRNGRLNPTEPRLYTVLLAPDDDRVTVVWVADLRLSRPVGPGRFAKIQHAVRWPDAR